MLVPKNNPVIVIGGHAIPHFCCNVWLTSTARPMHAQLPANTDARFLTELFKPALSASSYFLTMVVQSSLPGLGDVNFTTYPFSLTASVGRCGGVGRRELMWGFGMGKDGWKSRG